MLSGGEKLYAPLKIEGTDLKCINYTLPVASAQVKSAVILAGLYAEGQTVECDDGWVQLAISSNSGDPTLITDTGMWEFENGYYYYKTDMLPSQENSFDRFRRKAFFNAPSCETLCTLVTRPN